MSIENINNFENIQKSYKDNLNKLNIFLEQFNFKSNDVFKLNDYNFLLIWEKESKILNTKKLTLNNINNVDLWSLSWIIWAPISKEQKLSELNFLLQKLPIPKQKKYLEKWLKNFNTYEVQKNNWEETLYSIFNKLLSETDYSKWKLVLFRKLFLDWVEKGIILPNIKKWDIISFDIWDSNSWELKINWKIYSLNIENFSIY